METEAYLSWSSWQAVAPRLVLTPDCLAELLNGGQAFRWRIALDGNWLGQWSDFLISLKLDEEGVLHRRFPVSTRTDADPALRTYLGLEIDFPSILDALPWRSDPHLNRCLQSFPGLRILRQPFGETLLCFLCSATKQIVQIKQMVQLLANRHGAEILPGIFRLPTWSELAVVPEKILRECLLGFRARHIHATAQFLAEHSGWLEETEQLPYPEAKTRLCSLSGVGEKVADCVLLFGAGRLEAFPVDVWILRTMSLRYGLEGWSPPQVTRFGRVHFGSAAGLAQQYLFAWERRAANRPPAA